MKSRSILIAAALMTVAPAAMADNMANGKKLAQQLCTNCHIVEPSGGTKDVAADVPSFMAIAKTLKWDAGQVRGFIMNPHPPMPQVQLTSAELADIAAYIVSLKE